MIRNALFVFYGFLSSHRRLHFSFSLQSLWCAKRGVGLWMVIEGGLKRRIGSFMGGICEVEIFFESI